MTKQTKVKRPLFVFCAFFFATGILTADASSQIKLTIISLGVAFSALSTVIGLLAKRRRLALCAVFLVFLPITVQSGFQLATTDKTLAEAEIYDGISGMATLTVKGVRYSSSYYGYYTARLSGSDTFPDMTVSLGFPDGSCEVGDVLTGNVTLRSLENSSSFDEKIYFIPEGILMCAEAEDLSYAGKDDSFSLSGFFAGLNQRLTARIRATSDSGELSCAVLLGQRDLLDYSVKRDFARIGISHLLAVSGIHLSVTVAALELILEKCRIRGRKKTLVLCAAIVFYMALVGFSKSVTRAGLMHIIRHTGCLIGRKSDPRTSLGFAAVLIILFDPFAVYDTGFVLSVLACYACIVYFAYAKDRKKAVSKLYFVLRGILDTVKLTLLITALTLPVMWKVFGEVSLISPITNVFFIPVITLFLHFSLFYVIFCTAPVISKLLTPLLITAERVITVSAGKLSYLKHITVSLKWTGIGVWTILLFAAVFVSTIIYKKRRILSVVSVSICAFAIAVCITVGYITASGSAECVYVTRGKSEGFTVRCGNEYILIDVSDGSSGFSRELTFTAEAEGATEISALVLTHLHRRHIASVASLADSMILRQAFLPKAETESDMEVSESLRAVFERRGIPYTEYSREDGLIVAGDVTLEYPAYTSLVRSTHPVVAFSFTVAERRFVYLGSSFEEGYSFDDEVLSADTVFFGAHPPVRKKEANVSLTGKAILSYYANEKELLFVKAEGGMLAVKEDASYSTETFKR